MCICKCVELFPINCQNQSQTFFLNPSQLIMTLNILANVLISNVMVHLKYLPQSQCFVLSTAGTFLFFFYNTVTALTLRLYSMSLVTEVTFLTRPLLELTWITMKGCLWGRVSPGTKGLWRNFKSLNWDNLVSFCVRLTLMLISCAECEKL